MIDKKDLKETREAILKNYTLASLPYKTSRVQGLLEGLDELWQKNYPKWLAEKQRSALAKNKYHEKI